MRYSRLTIMAMAIKKNNHLRRVTEQTVNAKKKKEKQEKKLRHIFRENP